MLVSCCETLAYAALDIRLQTIIAQTWRLALGCDFTNLSHRCHWPGALTECAFPMAPLAISKMTKCCVSERKWWNCGFQANSNWAAGAWKFAWGKSPFNQKGDFPRPQKLCTNSEQYTAALMHNSTMYRLRHTICAHLLAFRHSYKTDVPHTQLHTIVTWLRDLIPSINFIC